MYDLVLVFSLGPLVRVCSRKRSLFSLPLDIGRLTLYCVLRHHPTYSCIFSPCPWGLYFYAVFGWVCWVGQTSQRRGRLEGHAWFILSSTLIFPRIGSKFLGQCFINACSFLEVHDQLQLCEKKVFSEENSSVLLLSFCSLSDLSGS